MTISQITGMVGKLNNLGFSPQIYRNADFYDEPRLFSYKTIIKLKPYYTDGLINKAVHGSGISLSSSKDALSKSIFEAMERFCEHSYKKKSIKYAAYKGNDRTFIDPTFLSKDPEIKNKKIGWVEGENLTLGKKCFLPARMVFLNYKAKKGEPSLDYPMNSSGSAGGSSPQHAILNGIYELIERDSFMGIYLNKISPPILDFSKSKDEKMKEIIERIKKYKLEIYILNTTTDIGIPSFVSLLIDRAGFPSVSLGAKAGLKAKEAILGAICESLRIRDYARNMLRDGDIASDLKSGVNVFAERARHWMLPDTTRNARFLMTGPKEEFKFDKFERTKEGEFMQVSKRLKKIGFNIYYCDITIKEFTDFNFYACQTVIPGLHPLYLYEKEKERSVNVERLKQVAGFFNVKHKGVNPFPHPFL